jgi:DNA invertase Pin-like site-specific DNA recombinase
MNAIYVRQSVDREDSISIETQIEHCLYEAKKEEYAVYDDKGFSGKNTERPNFKIMMEHIRQGTIKRVIVYKLDRISRSILDFSKMIEEFKKYGVEFVSTQEKFDTSTPMGRAMLSVTIVFAQLERETIQKRVIDAYFSRSRMGIYMGGRIPYGFKREPHIVQGINTSIYVPVKQEIEHMQIIFDMYSKPGVTLSDVIKHLRTEKILKARGAEWSTPRISEVLCNPIYVKADAEVYNFYAAHNTEIVNPPEDFIGENGCYLYTKDVKAMGSKKDMRQYHNMVLVLAPHKGIIDADVWLRCRIKADSNVQIPNAKASHITWLSRKLKCGICGYALRYSKWESKVTGKKNEYYLCSERTGNMRCTGDGSIKKHILENDVLRQIIKKVKEIEVEQSQPSQNQSEINLIKIAITKKEQEIDELLKKFEGGGEAVMRRLNRNVDELEAGILELKQQLLKLEMNKSNKLLIDTDMINEIFKRWDEIDLEDKEAIADTLISKVKATNGTIEIEWKV